MLTCQIRLTCNHDALVVAHRLRAYFFKDSNLSPQSAVLSICSLKSSLSLSIYIYIQLSALDSIALWAKNSIDHGELYTLVIALLLLFQSTFIWPSYMPIKHACYVSKVGPDTQQWRPIRKRSP